MGVRRAILVAAVVMLPVCSWATPALDPIPERNDIIESHPRRWGLMSGGLSLFAVAYAADAGVTYGFHHDPAGVSLIPVIGPLVQMGDHYGYQGPSVTTPDPSFNKQTNDQIQSASTLISTVTYVGLAVDFAAQLAGVTMAIVGAATHKTVLRAGRSRSVAFTGRGLGVTF
jgi:hypothetical protein